MKLPRATERKLKNGLPAMMIESQRSPSVAVELAPSATSLMNFAGMPGAEAAVVLKSRGWSRRRPRKTSTSCWIWWARCCSIRAFRRKSWTAGRRSSAANWCRCARRPRSWGWSGCGRCFTAGDARAIDEPTLESLDKIRRQDLMAFYKAYYRPGNSLLGVAGDISADAIVAKLEKEIGGWAPGRAERPDLGGRIRITSPAWR